MAFLAGYIAAGVSQTDKVGTFGGIPVPDVLGFMNGYAMGVAEYNAVYGKLNHVVPGHLKNDLKAIREGISDGSIPTQPF